jgi:protein-disulfide isomerase
VQISADVNNGYPEFSGTPAFIINGKMLADTANWEKLKPQLEDAVK